MKPIHLLLLALTLSCDPPTQYTPTCCTPTVIARDYGYVGTYVSDAGVATQVQLVVSASGEARVSFLREGNDIVETFQTIRR